MSTEEYIKEVYKKYAQTQEQNIKYKVVKMRVKRPLIPLCIITVCLMVAGYIGFELKNYERVENPGITDYVQSEDNKDKIYTDYIRVDTFMNSTYLNNMIINSTEIVLCSRCDIKNTFAQLEKEKILVKTNGSLEINKVLKTNKSLEKGKISYEKIGGKISFDELERTLNIPWKEIVEINKININEDINEKEKLSTYYEQIPSKGISFEDEKNYLVFLKYNEQTKTYEIFDMTYGIMEYDPQTNKVKNIDTGEFEEFDWDLIK